MAELKSRRLGPSWNPGAATLALVCPVLHVLLNEENKSPILVQPVLSHAFLLLMLECSPELIYFVCGSLDTPNKQLYHHTFEQKRNPTWMGTLHSDDTQEMKRNYMDESWKYFSEIFWSFQNCIVPIILNPKQKVP